MDNTIKGDSPKAGSTEKSPLEIKNLKRTQNVFGDIEDIDRLSKKYAILKEDVLLMALNASAMTSDADYRRIRFKFSVPGHPDDLLYLGIPVLKDNTPFHLSFADKTLSLNGKVVGNIIDAENDTCDTSYFRRGDTSLTLNTNARSDCTGCAICATHRQAATDKSVIKTEAQLADYMGSLFSSPEKFGEVRPHFHRPLEQSQDMDLSKLCQVTVVTGCFRSEEEAVKHLKMVHGYFASQGFDGEFRYIGSEIRSVKVLKELSEESDNMALCLSLECFTRRENLLRNSKASLTVDEAGRILGEAKSVGIKGGFTYIIGLDGLKDMTDGLNKLAPVVGELPTFQVFQPHWEEQKSLRHPDASSLEHYLTARKVIENIFEGTGFKPKPWQNYRSPWYFTFGNEPLNDIRI